MAGTSENAPAVEHGAVERPRRPALPERAAGRLATLARSGSRNARVIDRYVDGRAEFGKTLIFACDIQHAEALKRMLQQRGVSAEAVHSDLGHEDRRSVIRRFKEGRIRVLVNVAMLTHGVDIRDIETVFLARPTASSTLFAQMVGRAVRKAPGKTHFQLVDFVDKLKVHGDILVSPMSYFGAARVNPCGDSM